MQKRHPGRIRVLFLAAGICISIGIGFVYSGIVSSHTNLSSGLLAGGTPTPTNTPTASPTATPCGKIYSIGGFGSSGSITASNRIYDIPTNTWSIGAPMPTPKGDHATAYWNGKIYAVGGFDNSLTGSLFIYDIAANSWTQGPPMPTPEEAPGFGIINGKLYVAGGNNGVTEVDTLSIYDIDTNSWTNGSPLLQAVSGPGSAVYRGKLYLFGGVASFPASTATTQIYDPVADGWTIGPPMNTARSFLYGTSVSDTSIIAPGGFVITADGAISDNEQLTATWAGRATLPYNARAPFAVSDGTFVYIGGGSDGNVYHADLLRYDPVADTYTPLAPAGEAFFESQAVFVAGPCATPTATATNTPTPTVTSSFTPTVTPTATPTGTPIAGITFIVNTTDDTQDAAPGNDLCADANGMCSLRAAITESNAHSDSNTITLPAGIYTESLSAANENANAGGDFDITRPVNIIGEGSGTTIVQANASAFVSTERVFHILTGGINVTISGVTVRHGGNPVANAIAGGGIRVEGSTSNLTLNNSVVTHNTSERRGGGLAVADQGVGLTINNCSFIENIVGPGANGNASGGALSIDNEADTAPPVTMQINNTTFDSNRAESSSFPIVTFGGAVIIRAPGAIVHFQGCTFTNNSSLDTGQGSAGAIYAQNANVEISGSIISGNRARYSGGGGVSRTTSVATSSTSIGIFNTTISGNTAPGGGGWSNDGGSLQDLTCNIQGSTISGNSATDLINGGVGGLGNGEESNNTGNVSMNLLNSTVSGNQARVAGGIANFGPNSHLTLRYTTVAFNSVSGPFAQGGGLYQAVTPGGSTHIRASIIADNIGQYGLADISGEITSDGYNLVEDTFLTHFVPDPTDLTEVDPQLGPLRNYGGLTETHLPFRTSPVVDRQPSGLECTQVVDQRGEMRPALGGCDIGSVEVQVNDSDPSPTPTSTPTTTPTSTSTPTSTPTGSPTPRVRTVRADFDGDGRTDVSVYRPVELTWYLQRSSSGFLGYYFGVSGDVPVPGDYDGDGKTDIAVFRYGAFGSAWYRINSSDGRLIPFGFVNVPGYIPQAGDYDGRGSDQAAGFDPATGDWSWSAGPSQTVVRHWGQTGDKPCREDYDGDRKTDLCVYRDGVWYLANFDLSGQYGEQFGLPDDLPVPADYDGDGKADLAVFRPLTGDWYFHFSGDGSYGGIHWGQSGDVPVPGDYDGDGRNDIAVYRFGVWYINGSTAGPMAMQFGLNSDIPVPSKYIP